MFKGLQGLALTGDHLDISYHKPETWPAMTPKGSIRAFIFDIGDPEAGPIVMLGLASKVEDEQLDWKHSIDPVHHHGSDQFRVICGGEWTLAGKTMPAGHVSFQEAGWVYQEHPGPDHTAWTMLIMGDKRGNQATLKLKRDQESVATYAGDYEDVFSVEPTGKAYPHPAGDKGIAATATTAGPCVKGYRHARIAALDSALTGVLGDEAAGPVVHVVKAGPGETVIPPCTTATECVLTFVSGSGTVGADTYRGGELRVQAAHAPMDAVVAGPEGLELVLVIADRRVHPVMANGAQAPVWMNNVDSVLKDLKPTPGGQVPYRLRNQAAS